MTQASRVCNGWSLLFDRNSAVVSHLRCQLSLCLLSLLRHPVMILLLFCQLALHTPAMLLSTYSSIPLSAQLSLQLSGLLISSVTLVLQRLYTYQSLLKLA